MDAPHQAIGKIRYVTAFLDCSIRWAAKLQIFRSKARQENTTVGERVAPLVELETVAKHHEEKKHTVIDKKRKHYKTTVQPLKDREVLPEEHKHEQTVTEVRELDHDSDGDVKGEVDARNVQFKDTTQEVATLEKSTKGPVVTGEYVHHHLHGTVQPIIEKGIPLCLPIRRDFSIDVGPSVTYRTIPVTEKHQHVSKDHGTTTNSTIFVDEFQGRLDSEQQTSQDLYDGRPNVE